jgi:A/G-specific adenine glycosylase
VINEFSEKLLQWFARNGRKDLPWQQDPTTYRAWVSEIMLQQTQVTTVIPYYLRFMESFPGIDRLAAAGIDDVLHHWSGLGYYARARNLHKAAQIIRDDFAGEFPLGIDDVVALPGIGRSTAGAILALADRQRHAILDGNVKRVLARFHAVDGWPGNQAVAKKLWQFAEQHTPTKDVAAYTQAIMDLGATLCTRSKPRCSLCPVADDCVALRTGRQADFPGKKPKKAKPLKRTQMILLHSENSVLLQRRPPSGIWGGLWSLPELLQNEEASHWCSEKMNVPGAETIRWETIRHSFTHFDLDIEPIAVRVADVSRTVADSDEQIWYQLDAPPKLGLAAPVAGLLDKLRSQQL